MKGEILACDAIFLYVLIYQLEQYFNHLKSSLYSQALVFLFLLLFGYEYNSIISVGDVRLTRKS